MKKSFVPNFFSALTILLFATWFGSYVARQVMVYQLFEPVNLDLKPIYNSQNLYAVISVIMPVLITNLVSFPLFIISFVLYIAIAKINIKKEGWLFLTTVVIIITAPFEFYLSSSIDYKIVKLMINSSSDINETINLLRSRITELSSFPLIEVFSYVGLVFVIIFKPLRKNEN